jgi:DNA damage-inducible protein 1
MRISITFNGAITTVDVDPDMELINLKALIEAELTIPSQAQQLFHNGKPLNNDLLSVKLHGIKHDDILLVQAKQVSQSEQARHQILSNPQLKQQLISRNPQMEQALQDPVQFERIYTQMLQQQQAHDQRQSQLHNADELDVEAQRQIEEEIRNQNIHRNYETAIEHNPEFFGRVIMLYINVEVNGVKVKAFVDSGAQATIMSPDCADRCNVMQILDTRFAGEARGVGTAKILGYYISN